MPQKYKHKILSKAKAVKNLLSFYELASLTELTEGRQWYDIANLYCKELAGRFDLTVQQVAGIVAALSPQTGWTENKRFAVSFLLNPNRRVKSADQTEKAKQILNVTNESEIYSLLSVRDKAFKTKSFFVNMLNPDIATTVTIDRHAIGAILQHPNEVKSITEEYVQPTKAQYLFFVQCFTEAAKKAGVMPHQFQAIVWLVYRRLRELKQHQDSKQFEPFNNPDYDF